MFAIQLNVINVEEFTFTTKKANPKHHRSKPIFGKLNSSMSVNQWTPKINDTICLDETVSRLCWNGIISV